MLDGSVKEKGVACLRDVLSLVERERAEAIAIDNIYELAPSLDELQGLLSSLTQPPRLVQVTMIGSRAYQLSSLAASLGLGRGKLNPLQAAEVAAKLCYMGIGSELYLFERDETRVIVSKGRTPVQGGMSAERFKRNVESKAMRKTREIQQLLRERGIDFDLFMTKGAYGVERSVFIIYAPRERIYGIVKPVKDHDIQVSIEPVARREPSFVPLLVQPQKLRRATEYIIVGIDPGVSTGVAALTLDGELRLLTSGRELGRGQIIRMLLETGTPLVVCTDVTPPPSYVKKLATALNVVLIAPPTPLSIEDKRQLVSEFSNSSTRYVKVRDSHQRDALAAALYALNHLQPKLAEVREKVERLGLGIPVEEVQALVIRGAPVWDAIRQVSKSLLIPNRQRTPAHQPGQQTATHLSEAIHEKMSELLKKVKDLEREREELLNKLQTLEAQLERLLQAQSYEIRREREVEVLKSRLDNILKDHELLMQKVENLKNDKEALEVLIERTAVGEVVLAPRLGSVSAISEVSSPSGVVVLGFLSSSDAQRLKDLAAKRNLKVIICEQPPPSQLVELLACYDVTVLSVNEVKPLTVVNTVYIFDKNLLDAQVNRKLKDLEYKSKEHIKNIFKSIVESYKNDRTKILSQHQKENV